MTRGRPHIERQEQDAIRICVCGLGSCKKCALDFVSSSANRQESQSRFLSDSILVAVADSINSEGFVLRK